MGTTDNGGLKADDAACLAALVGKWEELREQGLPVTPEDVCRDRPDLLEALRRQIAALLPVPLPQEWSDPSLAIPGHEVLCELGRGGMGVVYKARQVKLNRPVALKVMLARVLATSEVGERFRKEAEALARLQHPNIVQVFEVGEHQGWPYFSMELVEGGSLKDRLAGGPLPPCEAATLVEVLAWAVQAAHERGVVHRDLKPSNVLLTPAGVPKVADFGLAKRLDEQGATHTGDIIGTPSYMAPEQARGKKDVGPAVDVYALGVILYELLVGRVPFHCALATETLLQVLEDEPEPPRKLRAEVPRDLETICLVCLAKEPAGRYASARDLAEDLARFRAGEPVHARPPGVFRRIDRWVRKHPALTLAYLGWLLAAVVLPLVFPVSVGALLGKLDGVTYTSAGVVRVSPSASLRPRLEWGSLFLSPGAFALIGLGALAAVRASAMAGVVTFPLAAGVATWACLTEGFPVSAALVFAVLAALFVGHLCRDRWWAFLCWAGSLAAPALTFWSIWGRGVGVQILQNAPSSDIAFGTFIWFVTWSTLGGFIGLAARLTSQGLERPLAWPFFGALAGAIGGAYPAAYYGHSLAGFLPGSWSVGDTMAYLHCSLIYCGALGAALLSGGASPPLQVSPLASSARKTSTSM